MPRDRHDPAEYRPDRRAPPWVALADPGPDLEAVDDRTQARWKRAEREASRRKRPGRAW